LTLKKVVGHGSFPGIIFHIQDVENEPPVKKENPPRLGQRVASLDLNYKNEGEKSIYNKLWLGLHRYSKKHD
jgi:hypothetical protein